MGNALVCKGRMMFYVHLGDSCGNGGIDTCGAGAGIFTGGTRQTFFDCRPRRGIGGCRHLSFNKISK